MANGEFLSSGRSNRSGAAPATEVRRETERGGEKGEIERDGKREREREKAEKEGITKGKKDGEVEWDCTLYSMSSFRESCLKIALRL